MKNINQALKSHHLSDDDAIQVHYFKLGAKWAEQELISEVNELKAELSRALAPVQVGLDPYYLVKAEKQRDALKAELVAQNMDILRLQREVEEIPKARALMQEMAEALDNCSYEVAPINPMEDYKKKQGRQALKKYQASKFAK